MPHALALCRKNNALLPVVRRAAYAAPARREFLMIRVLAMIAVLAAAPLPAIAGPALDALFAGYWANELKEDPFAATYAGVDGYNDRVPGVAP
ncbi:MAG: hypothetical protein AB7P23_13620, partial [Amphiplicatus sp.]